MACVLNLPSLASNGVTLTNLALLATICILSRIGGYSDKNMRRTGVGVVLAIYGFYVGLSWWLAFSCIVASQIFRLQITFTGDSIDNAVDYVWVYIMAFLWTLAVLPFYFYAPLKLLPKSILYSAIVGTMIILSNKPKTADLFRWDFVECFYSSLLALLAVSV